MQKFGILRGLICSFFSKAFYLDVALQWRGIAAGYLLLLVAICWLPAMIAMQININTFVQNDAPKITRQLPIIDIYNGEAKIDKPMPYFIHFPDSQRTLAIIDTSGHYTTLDNVDAVVLLTKTALFVKRWGIHVRQYSLKKIPNMQITPETANRFLDRINHFFTVTSYPIVVLFSFVYRLLQGLVYAVIGTWILAKILRVDLNYQQVLRLSLTAITPALVLNTVLSFFAIEFRYQFFLYFMLAMAYLSFAILANQMVVEPPEAHES